MNKILKEKVIKAGYVLRTEIVEMIPGQKTTWTMAYTPDGQYIGDPKIAYRLIVKRGIQPQRVKQEHCVTSVGFSIKDGKWYGWSHRAIYGFKIGSRCRKGDCHYTPRNLGGRGAWMAKTVADARQMAIDFASGVS